MLPKKQRLNLSKQENRRVFKNQVYNGRVLKAYAQKIGSEFKAAAVAPKSKIKSAVDRNKIRRTIYTAIGQFLKEAAESGQIKNNQGIKIIFLVKTKIADAEFKELTKEVKQGLKEIILKS